MSVLTDRNLEEINARLGDAAPQAVVEWAVKAFPEGLAMTSSFGPGSVALLHLASQVKPDLPILFIDTGFHFSETIQYRDEVVSLLGLNLVICRPAMPREDFVREHGEDLYSRNPDLCCAINKVEPLASAVAGLAAWINGRRRSQAVTRRNLQVVERYEGDLVKINPILNWTSKDVFLYMQTHHLPQHPLWEQGYMSIGCAPCTRPITDGEDERAGRWAGHTKVECGIHTFLEKK